VSAYLLVLFLVNPELMYPTINFFKPLNFIFMKKITLILTFVLLSSLTAFAQYSFPAVAGPTNVPNGAPVTLSINDMANAAGVPAGQYATFSVSADWGNPSAEGPWSSEANLSMNVTSGNIAVNTATTGGAGNGNATTLTFDGTFTAPYDAAVDGTMDIVLDQNWGPSSADWSNIVITITPVLTCTPAVATAAVVEDCGNSQFSVDVNVTDLGDSGTITISNDGGVPSTPASSLGVVSVGPFAMGTPVVITLEHETDVLCNVALTSVVDACPKVNDSCAGALPVACANTYMGDTSVASTDTGENGAADLWHSFTGGGSSQTVTLSLCASGYDTMIRVFDACGGTEIANNDDFCGTRSETSFISDGTSTYYIMVEGYGTSTGAYQLDVTCAAVVPAPANDMCANATGLTLGVVLASETSAGALENLADAKPSCDTFGNIADVWYTFVAPASGEVTAMTTVTTGSSTEANILIYDNTIICGGALATAEVAGGCSDVGGDETLAVTGLTGGNTYTVRVWTDGSTSRMVNSSTARISGTFDIVIHDTTILGIEDLKFTEGFTMFPNPVENKLTVSAKNEIKELLVVNVLGQTVKTVTPNSRDYQLDLSNLTSGIYFVKARVNNSEGTFRVIKK